MEALGTDDHPTNGLLCIDNFPPFVQRYLVYRFLSSPLLHIATSLVWFGFVLLSDAHVLGIGLLEPMTLACILSVSPACVV